MNVSILIPQLFYDLIARMTPGAVLIACAFVIFEGPTDGPHRLTTWSDNSALVLMGDVLAAHILGTLLGGIWFRVYRLNLLKDPKGACKHSIWVKWLHGWAKNGESRIDEAFDKTFGNNWPALGAIKMRDMNPTGRVALIYDYIQLRCPRAGARIAKLRAEQHMCGVLMIGCLLLAGIYGIFPSVRYPDWHPSRVETVLLFSALTAGWLAWHLEKRSGTASYFSWYLVWSGIAEEDGVSEASTK
jgi:hypothetical protein